MNEQQQTKRKQHQQEILQIQATIGHRVNADNSSKASVAVFWILFAWLLLLVFFTSNYTPQAFTYKLNKRELFGTHHQKCNNPVDFQEGKLYCREFGPSNPKLGLILTNLTPLNQFAQINLLIIPNQSVASTIQLQQTIDIQIMTLSRVQQTVNNKKAVLFKKGKDARVTQGIKFSTKNHELVQVMDGSFRIDVGYQINLGFYRDFQSQDALAIVKFSNISEDIYKNCEFALFAILMNDNYTKYIIVMRAVFIAITAISIILFTVRVKYFVSNIIIFQQKMVLKLSVAIILFNDPYYFIGIFKPNIFSLFVETVFISAFFIILLWSWVYMLQRINYESRGQRFVLTRFAKTVYCILGLDYFLVIAAFNYNIGYYAMNQSPIVPNHQVFSKLYVMMAIFFGGLTLYLAYMYARVFQVWQNVIWRNKIYVCFNIFFIVLMMVFVFLGWFSIYDESSQKFQIFYASMNIYVVYMQYMYSYPLKRQGNELHQQFHQLQTETTITLQSQENPIVCIDLDVIEMKKQKMMQEVQQ